MKSIDSLSTISSASTNVKKNTRFYKKKYVKNQHLYSILTKRYFKPISSLFRHNNYNKYWNLSQCRKETLFWIKFLVDLLHFNKTTYWISLQILLQL